ncbi:MAG: hypothetical protein OMM_10606 [Candidatus Magnetoglobus multicellularis str. Araruama]|uniref:Uncharacterized protein n=1 Tax=Candidatus Magnetoglobus multicellularis str. Araruama TaxID=890399 RepID=A0A1V1P0G8_9BACT|nr:MAG: hypothetical protein OMM_10606 [Candidatus Magnetoglobus multicellularis str. Araruama]
MALLEPEKVSDYEVKWISDSLDKKYQDVEALKKKEFQSEAKKEKEKEKEAQDNQSIYNYETKNPVAKEAETTQPAIVYNKDFQKTDTKASSVHMRVESRLLIEDIKDVEAAVIEPEKAAIKHLTAKELQPKKKFVDKIKGFFAKLG